MSDRFNPPVTTPMIRAAVALMLLAAAHAAAPDPRLAPLAAPATPLIAGDPYFQT